jgi:uncharacterized protein (TIGR00369 family)
MNNWKIKNPDFEKDIRKKLEGQAFMHHLGMDLDVIEAGYIVGSMPIRNFLTQQNGYVHGGVMATAADVVMGFAAFTLVGKRDRVVTVDLNMNFLRPGEGEKLQAEGRVLKAGRNIFYCEAALYVFHGETKILTNKATSTMYRIDPDHQTDPSKNSF